MIKKIIDVIKRYVEKKNIEKKKIIIFSHCIKAKTDFGK